MKSQFSTSSLLLTTTFIAIWLSGVVAAWKLMVSAQHDYLVQTVIYLGPFWFPFVFVAYVLGRREISAKCVLAFALSEAAVFGAAMWLTM
jgi:hypothetical protein